MTSPRQMIIALALAGLVTPPGCSAGGGSVEAPGLIVISDGSRLQLCRPAEGACAPLIRDPGELPRHDLQLWPGPGRSGGAVLFEAQAINGPNALVEVDLSGRVLGVFPEAHLPALSPRGDRVAYYAGGDLVLRSLEGEEPARTLAKGMEKRVPPVWISESRLVFRDSDGATQQVNLDTGGVEVWRGPSGFPGAATSEVLLVSDGKMIVEQSLGGAKEPRVLRKAGAASLGYSVIPSPDGRWLAYVAGRSFSPSEKKDVHLLDRRTGEDAVLLENTTVFGGIWIDE